MKKEESDLKSEDGEKPKPEVENIKQMQDVRSSQASAVIQLFLRQIQEAYISNDVAGIDLIAVIFFSPQKLNQRTYFQSIDQFEKHVSESLSRSKIKV